MSVQRFLDFINGRFSEVVPATSSAGTATAGQIVALNAAGAVDVTMLPTGVGPDTQAMVASEALSAGAFVNVYSNAGTQNARNADGSTTGKQADGFVLAAVASGGSATVYMSGLNTSVSAQTPGLVYLSDTAVGAAMVAGATTAGHTFQQIGTAVSATAIQFAPQAPVVRA